jgi:hypothetical protein
MGRHHFAADQHTVASAIALSALDAANNPSAMAVFAGDWNLLVQFFCGRVSHAPTTQL